MWPVTLMNQQTPQQRGRAWEDEFAQRIGAVAQLGSGNVWFARMDVEGASFLFSCKHTDFKSFPLTQKDMVECVEAILGFGGFGGDTIPGMAIRTADEQFVTFRLNDFLRVVQEKRTLSLQSKGDAKRERANVPGLLREEPE